MMEVEIRSMETTEGLYVRLDDIIDLTRRMAWVCGSMPLSILHNLLKRGEHYEGQIKIKLDK
jgi:hypothetical protein